MKRNIVIADHSELILNGLRSILQPLAGEGIVSFTKYAPLKEYLKVTKNILLIIDYTSKGFSLNKVVELKNKYPKMLVMALTPYTNAQTIVQAVEAGIESHIKKECSVQEIKDAFTATSGGTKFFCNDIVAQMRKENINPKNTVAINPLTSPFLSFSNIAWCAHVTVVPDNSKMRVLINGISHGSNVFISGGGQVPPIDSVGNKLALKYAQNHATKNITSEAIKSVIPYR